MQYTPDGSSCPELVQYKESLQSLCDITEIRCGHDDWHDDEYMRGMTNGLILALGIFEHESPVFLEKQKIHILKDSYGETLARIINNTVSFIRRTVYCRIGNHHNVKYDSGIPHDFGNAGICHDCSEIINQNTAKLAHYPKMPPVKPAKKEDV